MNVSINHGLSKGTVIKWSEVVSKTAELEAGCVSTNLDTAVTGAK